MLIYAKMLTCAKLLIWAQAFSERAEPRVYVSPAPNWFNCPPAGVAPAVITEHVHAYKILEAEKEAQKEAEKAKALGNGSGSGGAGRGGARRSLAGGANQMKTDEDGEDGVRPIDMDVADGEGDGTICVDRNGNATDAGDCDVFALDRTAGGVGMTSRTGAGSGGSPSGDSVWNSEAENQHPAIAISSPDCKARGRWPLTPVATPPICTPICTLILHSNPTHSCADDCGF
jgi:hypothetical protein